MEFQLRILFFQITNQQMVFSEVTIDKPLFIVRLAAVDNVVYLPLR